MHPLQAIGKLVLVRSLSDLTRLKIREHLGLLQFFKLQSIRANLKYKFKVIAPERMSSKSTFYSTGAPQQNFDVKTKSGLTYLYNQRITHMEAVRRPSGASGSKPFFDHQGVQNYIVSYLIPNLF